MTIEELHLLVTNTLEIESDIKLLEATQKELRGKIQGIVESHGGAVVLDNFASCKITAESNTTSYDNATIDDILSALNDRIRVLYADGIADDVRIAQELSGWAERISKASKVSTRKPSLRIVKLVK